MEFMAWKLKEEHEKWGLTMNLGKKQIYMYRRRNRNFRFMVPFVSDNNE
jgi:hypothetical protein